MSKTLPIAVQVYSVREEAERDFAGTMKKLGEMGYDGVELAGLYGKSAEEIRDSIKAAGLTAISAHVSYDELAGDLEKTLQDYETIGCRYIVIPWLGEDRRFGAALYEETIKEIPVISEGCKKHGMTLLYHNHDFEFAKTPDGTYALDQLYAEVPADVLGAEPDTCWIKVGGPDPSEWLKKYSGRCPLVHVKDFRRKADGVDLLALGEGEQDFPTLVKTAKECGAQWLVIEQDDHPYGTPMGDMKKSLNYLKELGKESDMTKIIKAGVVGCGGIANGKHFPAIKKNGKIELVAFCDLIKERAEKAKEEYGTPDARVYTDYTELVKEDVDVVYVLTPNNAHAPVSIAAMKAGKHVMCEKPMAKTYAEAKEMVKTAKETGKILTIGYQNRYRADSQYLKSACEADELGEIYYAKAHAIRRRAVPTWGVFIDEEKQGGGPLIDIGTHALDLTLWMMNNYEPASVTGSTYRKLADQTQTGNAWGDWDPKKFTVEDSAFGFIKMKNGATIVLEASWALNSLDVDEAKTSLCGTKAGADMKDGLRINRVHHGRQCVEKPDLGAGGVAFYDGTEEKPYATIQTAVNTIPLITTAPITIWIDDGAYLEDVVINGLSYRSLMIKPINDISSINPLTSDLPVRVRSLATTTCVGYTQISGIQIVDAVNAPIDPSGNRYGIMNEQSGYMAINKCKFSENTKSLGYNAIYVGGVSKLNMYGNTTFINQDVALRVRLMSEALAGLTGSGNNIGIKCEDATVRGTASTAFATTPTSISGNGLIISKGQVLN